MYVYPDCEHVGVIVVPMLLLFSKLRFLAYMLLIVRSSIIASIVNARLLKLKYPIVFVQFHV